MKVVLRVHSDHEFMPFWYAFVEISAELMQFLKIVHRIGVRALREMHPHFLRIEYIDATPAFTGQNCPEAFDAFVTSDEWNDNNKALLPDDIQLPRSEGIDVATLQIEDDGFRWTVRAKHCDSEGFTETLYYSEVFDDE